MLHCCFAEDNVHGYVLIMPLKGRAALYIWSNHSKTYAKLQSTPNRPTVLSKLRSFCLLHELWNELTPISLVGVSWFRYWFILRCQCQFSFCSNLYGCFTHGGCHIISRSLSSGMMHPSKQQICYFITVKRLNPTKLYLH